MKFTVLIEEDFAQRNFAGYIPELRLSAVGDSEVELIASLQDLIKIEMEHQIELPIHLFEVQTITVPSLKGGE